MQGENPEEIPLERERRELAERLHLAIEKRFGRGEYPGYRKFQEAMHERSTRAKERGEEVRGTALSSIQTYLAGSVWPSPSFLKVAADVLEARSAWLEAGHGERTEELEAARLAEGAAISGTPPAVAEALTSALGHPLSDLPSNSRAALLRAFAASQTVPMPAGADRLEDIDPLQIQASAVVDAIYAPLRRLGRDPAAGVWAPPDEALHSYIVGVSLALSHLFDALRRDPVVNIVPTPDPEDDHD